MTEDTFYRPNRPPVARRQPTPREPFWSLRQGHVTWSCELRYHSEFGVEAQIFRDAEFFAGRRFDTRARAVQWAELERQAWMKEG